MPLDKSPSKEALKQNFLTEIQAGKPKKQALKIAYVTKARATRRKPR